VSEPAPLELLATLPHFQLLERDLLERLAAAARLKAYSAGETVFREGEACRGFFAIRSGGVKLYRTTPDGREQVVHNLGAGQTFAEAALLNIGRYPATAVATESPTELVEIAGGAFMRVFREDDRLAAAMVGSLCMRLLSLVERVEELSLVHASARLARYLVRQPGRAAAGRIELELALPKKELAAHLSMTPETLSRLLRRFQAEGLIESGRTSLTVLDGERLQALADGETPPARPPARPPA
jgi:CRP/FNR family transcriptional regulator